jgi:crooked neck
MNSRATAIKNRAPAPIQITAEQLLREAQERGFESSVKAPKQFITDKEELSLYQQSKRKDFEEQLQRQRSNIGIWCKYALWEASQLEFERARSVFERALDSDYRQQTIWLKYAEMEMKNKFINHARNVWDRAVTLLPRIDAFWYKYSYMEEMIGAVDNARQIFERWMTWEPDDLAWSAYIKFEVRQSEISRARAIFERYVKLWSTARAYLKYARWEEDQQEKAFARVIYERSLKELHPQEKTDKLLVNFARFEERCKEYQRAKVIYQYALSESNLSYDLTELKKEYLQFEKRHGGKNEIEEALTNEKRAAFESQLSATDAAYNYDLWFDYIKLEESIPENHDRVRNIYERAIVFSPMVNEKKFWKRYIYLWIGYAVWEELSSKSYDRARSVYRRFLEIIPHKNFTFGKVWLMAAQLEIRQKNLSAARLLLGQAIGKYISPLFWCESLLTVLGVCGKENIFRGYIDFELQLGEIDRCRAIFSKFVAVMPFNCSAWKSFAELEHSLGEAGRARFVAIFHSFSLTFRCRAVYTLAIHQPELDMPELLWKSFIDFEIQELELHNARTLYEQLLQRTNHVKVELFY